VIRDLHDDESGIEESNSTRPCGGGGSGVVWWCGVQGSICDGSGRWRCERVSAHGVYHCTGTPQSKHVHILLCNCSRQQLRNAVATLHHRILLKEEAHLESLLRVVEWEVSVNKACRSEGVVRGCCSIRVWK
jgi:hypothetical protein